MRQTTIIKGKTKHSEIWIPYCFHELMIEKSCIEKAFAKVWHCYVQFVSLLNALIHLVMCRYEEAHEKGGVNLAKSGFFGSGIERKTRTEVRSLFH